MKKIMIMAACAALASCGCRHIELEDYGEEALRDADGKILVDAQGVAQKVRKGYKLEHDGHWLQTDADGISGGIGRDGTMNFQASGLKSSVSEEFNRSMLTYTSTIIDIARLAAAAYNPASTGVTPAAKAQTPVADCQSGACTNAAACSDCQP